MTVYTKPFNIYALDLGTTKFCLAALRPSPEQGGSPIETISVNADGMRRGMLADFNKAEKALLTLIEIAEKEFKSPISKVIVGIAGSHLQSGLFTTKMPMSQPQVSEQTLASLQQQAKRAKASFHKETLHALPITYRLDDREWTRTPLGFSGSSITGSFFRIEADKHYMSDVINLCNRCGLEIVNLYAEPFASASVTLLEQEKEYGVMIADIGGGTTDGIIYSQGCPIKLFTINIGGVLMTHDLAIGLGIPYETAEHLKMSIGLNKNRLATKLEVQNIHQQAINISGQDMYMILFARILELAQFLKKEMQEVGCPLNAGIVLTGGGSEVLGLEQVMSYILKTNVKKMLPDPYQHLPAGKFKSTPEHQQLASKYSTVTGMLLLEALSRQALANNKRHHFVERYFHSFINWMRELS